jgi:tetratricopeptide (TPR) repeat protein
MKPSHRIVLFCAAAALSATFARADDKLAKTIAACGTDHGGLVAIRACTTLIDGDNLPPGIALADLYDRRSLLYEEAGRLDDARRDLDKTVELSTTGKWRALFNRGLFLSARQNDQDGAMADLNAAIALKADEPKLYQQRGNAEWHLRRFDDALADFDRALKLNPAFAEVFEDRALVYFSMQDYDRSIADHDKAIALKPEFAQAYINRGSAYEGKNQHERAIADFDRAISLDPMFGQAFVDRGRAYLALDKPDRALKDLEVAVTLRPDDPLAYSLRGTAYLALRQPDRAIADFDKVLTIVPDDPLTLRRRSHARRLMGDDYGANADLAKSGSAAK